MNFLYGVLVCVCVCVCCAHFNRKIRGQHSCQRQCKDSCLPLSLTPFLSCSTPRETITRLGSSLASYVFFMMIFQEPKLL